MTRAISMGLIWLWIAVACVPLAKSESETNLTENSEAMRVWHTGQGLPSDNVTAILQTHDGFLWIGTSSRLARFDGVKFTELREPDSWTNSMTGITALCEDSTGHLWIGTQQNGL